MNQQVVALQNDRFMIPEALFDPSDIGIRQAGIVENIDCCLQMFSPAIRELLVQNIVLTGGNTLLPQFKDRIVYPFLLFLLK